MLKPRPAAGTQTGPGIGRSRGGNIVGGENFQGSSHNSPPQLSESNRNPHKRRGLCLQATASRNPCRDCEECIWIDQVPMDKDYADIVSIHAASGCHKRGGVEIKLDFPAMRVTWSKYQTWDAETGCDDPPLEEKIVDIESTAMGGFMQGLKECGLLCWGERYELDEGPGAEWVIRIEFDGFRVKKSGQNSYPRRWESLCQLFSDYWQIEFR